MRVLVLGASGMLGSTVLRVFAKDPDYHVLGTTRSTSASRHFTPDLQPLLIAAGDALDYDALMRLISRANPDVVVNCVGLIKQHAKVNDPLITLPVNALFPHRLATLCELARARLIHISTDCVFSGKKGNYTERDKADAEDLYGISKSIGEIHDFPNTVTLRTSIIGHGVTPNRSLVDWFLSRHGKVRGYTRAVFSGLPTVELAHVIKDTVLPMRQLQGLYHVSSRPIDKFSLLCLIAREYGKYIEIEPDDRVVVDRSLNSGRFLHATGYVAPDWTELIARMHNDCAVDYMGSW